MWSLSREQEGPVSLESSSEGGCVRLALRTRMLVRSAGAWSALHEIKVGRTPANGV
jgi:hypothetical protein